MSESKPIIYQCEQYLKRIPLSVKVENADCVLQKIEETKSPQQQEDYLDSFILATLLGHCAKRLVFEENCKQHPSKGPHDIVIYLNDDNDTRIVNEIKRLKPTAWDQKERVRNLVEHTGKFYEVKDDPNRSTTGFFDTILKEVETKDKQLDPNNTNIIWFSSRGTNHYEAGDIEDAAGFYVHRQPKLPPDQPGYYHKKPKHLTALGWFWDGNPQCTPLSPHCFFLVADRVADVLKKWVGNTIKIIKTFNNTT